MNFYERNKKDKEKRIRDFLPYMIEDGRYYRVVESRTYISYRETVGFSTIVKAHFGNILDCSVEECYNIACQSIIIDCSKEEIGNLIEDENLHDSECYHEDMSSFEERIGVIIPVCRSCQSSTTGERLVEVMYSPCIVDPEIYLI